MASNLFDDVFLQDLALETAQGAFQRFITMYLDFCQFFIHLLRRYPNDSGGRALFRWLVELPEQLGKINLPNQRSRQRLGLHLPDARLIRFH